MSANCRPNQKQKLPLKYTLRLLPVPSLTLLLRPLPRNTPANFFPDKAKP